MPLIKLITGSYFEHFKTKVMSKRKDQAKAKREADQAKKTEKNIKSFNASQDKLQKSTNYNPKRGKKP